MSGWVGFFLWAAFFACVFSAVGWWARRHPRETYRIKTYVNDELVEDRKVSKKEFYKQ